MNHDAEKEGEAAQRFIVLTLETLVVKPVSAGTDQEEHGNANYSRQDRIQPPQAVEHVGDIGAQNNESRMGDIDDVELTERNGEPEAHRGIKAAQQHAGDQRIKQEIDGEQRTTALPETGNVIPSRAG